MTAVKPLLGLIDSNFLVLDLTDSRERWMGVQKRGWGGWGGGKEGEEEENWRGGGRGGGGGGGGHSNSSQRWLFVCENGWSISSATIIGKDQRKPFVHEPLELAKSGKDVILLTTPTNQRQNQISDLTFLLNFAKWRQLFYFSSHPHSQFPILCTRWQNIPCLSTKTLRPVSTNHHLRQHQVARGEESPIWCLR